MSGATERSGRRRQTARTHTAEDQALNQIAKEAESRLAAKRAERAQAREIRMRELERLQKETEEKTDRVYEIASTDYSRVGVKSSRLTRDENLEETRDLKSQLSELEEKFKKAMMNTALLDNEKQALLYQVDLLKDKLDDQEEQLTELQREHKDKCRQYEAHKRSYADLERDFNVLKEQLAQRDKLIQDHGLVIVGTDSGELTLAKNPDVNGPVVQLGAALVSPEAAKILEEAGEGSLGTSQVTPGMSEHNLESKINPRTSCVITTNVMESSTQSGNVDSSGSRPETTSEVVDVVRAEVASGGKDLISVEALAPSSDTCISKASKVNEDKHFNKDSLIESRISVGETVENVSENDSELEKLDNLVEPAGGEIINPDRDNFEMKAVVIVDKDLDKGSKILDPGLRSESTSSEADSDSDIFMDAVEETTETIPKYQEKSKASQIPEIIVHPGSRTDEEEAEAEVTTVTDKEKCKDLPGWGAQVRSKHNEDDEELKSEDSVEEDLDEVPMATENASRGKFELTPENPLNLSGELAAQLGPTGEEVFDVGGVQSQSLSMLSKVSAESDTSRDSNSDCPLNQERMENKGDVMMDVEQDIGTSELIAKGTSPDDSVYVIESEKEKASVEIEEQLSSDEGEFDPGTEESDVEGDPEDENRHEYCVDLSAKIHGSILVLDRPEQRHPITMYSDALHSGVVDEILVEPAAEEVSVSSSPEKSEDNAAKDIEGGPNGSELTDPPEDVFVELNLSVDAENALSQVVDTCRNISEACRSEIIPEEKASSTPAGLTYTVDRREAEQVQTDQDQTHEEQVNDIWSDTVSALHECSVKDEDSLIDDSSYTAESGPKGTSVSDNAVAIGAKDTFVDSENDMPEQRIKSLGEAVEDAKNVGDRDQEPPKEEYADPKSPVKRRESYQVANEQDLPGAEGLQEALKQGSVDKEEALEKVQKLIKDESKGFAGVMRGGIDVSSETEPTNILGAENQEGPNGGEDFLEQGSKDNNQTPAVSSEDIGSPSLADSEGEDDDGAEYTLDDMDLDEDSGKISDLVSLDSGRASKENLNPDLDPDDSDSMQSPTGSERDFLSESSLGATAEMKGSVSKDSVISEAGGSQEGSAGEGSVANAEGVVVKRPPRQKGRGSGKRAEPAENIMTPHPEEPKGDAPIPLQRKKRSRKGRHTKQGGRDVEEEDTHPKTPDSKGQKPGAGFFKKFFGRT